MVVPSLRDSSRWLSFPGLASRAILCRRSAAGLKYLQLHRLVIELFEKIPFDEADSSRLKPLGMTIIKGSGLARPKSCPSRTMYENSRGSGRFHCSTEKHANSKCPSGLRPGATRAMLVPRLVQKAECLSYAAPPRAPFACSARLL